MQFLIRGKKLAFRFVNRLRRGDLGVCDAPDIKNRAIKVKRGLEPSLELDVILHELLHAAYWDLDEYAIDEGSSDIAKALWKLGYRKL